MSEPRIGENSAAPGRLESTKLSETARSSHLMFEVACPSCKATYQVDERRVPATGLKMRCPKCGESFQVAAPGAAAGAAPAGAPTEGPVLGAALGLGKGSGL